MILILCILVYSRFWGIKGLKTREILIQDDIPQSYDGLKIVHFADIHYKKVITEKDVSSLISKINYIKPDIVIFSGDLVDNDYHMTGKDIEFLIKEFSQIEAKYGCYAVLGDQDIRDKETVNNIYVHSDFTLLDNDSVFIQNENNDKILLVGLSNNRKSYQDILKQNENNSYGIFIVHEPDAVDEILKYDNRASLILSSHSIHGSINIPIVRRFFLPKGARKYYRSYYKINNTKLYISNGVGLNDVNFRFLNTPSINFYRLKKN